MRVLLSTCLGLALLLWPDLAIAGGRGSGAREYRSTSSHSRSSSRSRSGTSDQKKTEEVSGYRRKDGKYVEKYHRRPAGTAPSKTKKR